MEESDDIKFMRRCHGLALNAEGMTYPNPMVGSVVVLDGIIIGEGYHLRSGMPHAEVNAINSVKDKSLLGRSTLYVNLEPCSHYGKTPPCADYIISCHIPRIVIGTTDTSAKVSGKGIDKLVKAGCEVVSGIMDKESRWINRRFFTFHEKKRPYIILKWAQSSDGFIDNRNPEDHNPGPVWISGKPERALVHRWRATEAAILAGAGTIRADNPRLNVRNWTGTDPLKVILSGSGVLPYDAAVFMPGSKTVIFTYNGNFNNPFAETILLKDGIPPALQIPEYLFSKGIQSLFIEGGAAVFDHFISEGLWDEARVFKGDIYFGKGVKAPIITGRLSSRSHFGGSTLEVILNNSQSQHRMGQLDDIK